MKTQVDIVGEQLSRKYKTSVITNSQQKRCLDNTNTTIFDAHFATFPRI